MTLRNLLPLQVVLLSLACSSSSSAPPTTDDAATSGETAAPATNHLLCEKEGDHCTCAVSVKEQPTPVSCAAKDFSPDALCCADSGYPSKEITACQCVQWSCFESASTCECSLGLSGDKSACSGTFMHCCEHHVAGLGEVNSCRCSNFACADGDVEVPSCSAKSGQCADGKTKVASCAP